MSVLPVHLQEQVTSALLVWYISLKVYILLSTDLGSFYNTGLILIIQALVEEPSF